MKRFHVWSPEEEDRDCALKITAPSAGSAAEEWARRSDWDSADYSIAKGEDAVVAVAEEGTEESRNYIVSGQQVIEYTARLQVTK